MSVSIAVGDSTCTTPASENYDFHQQMSIDPIQVGIYVQDMNIELLSLAKVCYSESRRQRDCQAIRMVSHALTGCVTAQGRYTKCSNPHVREETPTEALHRHSGRVLGVKNTDRRRLLWIREFNLGATRPSSFTEEEWARVRPFWLESIAWARDAIEKDTRVCNRTPITWGGAMDTAHVISRGLVPVNCGDTANTFYAVGRSVN